MKRFIICIVMIIFAILTCSCEDQGEIDQKDIDSIYEIDVGCFKQETQVNHKNIINNDEVVSVDENALKTRTLSLGGCDYEMIYQDSIYYPVGDYKVDRYFIDGNEEKSVLVNRNGDIYALFFAFSEINISNTDTPEDVLPVLREELGKIIDMTKYEKVHIPKMSESDKENGFRTYSFTFYNERYGFTSDTVTVFVSGNGNVRNLRIYDFPDELLSTKIENKKVEQLVEAKIKDMYTTDYVEYISCRIFGEKKLVIYQGEPCILCSVSPQYYEKESDKEWPGWLFDILIPTRLAATNP